MRPRRWPGALALVLAAALWGLGYWLEPQREELRLEAVALTDPAEGAPLLKPGQTAPGGVAYINRSQAGCRVRVKVCAPELIGEPALLAGNLVEGRFQEAGTGGAGQEGWVRRAGYLYYQNTRTGDLLPPGRQTPAAYTAVQLREGLDPDQLDTLRDWGAELYLVAQAQQEEGGDWR